MEIIRTLGMLLGVSEALGGSWGIFLGLGL